MPNIPPIAFFRKLSESPTPWMYLLICYHAARRVGNDLLLLVAHRHRLRRDAPGQVREQLDDVRDFRALQLAVLVGRVDRRDSGLLFRAVPGAVRTEHDSLRHTALSHTITASTEYVLRCEPREIDRSKV
jgi:hypothetical protein